MKFCNYYVYIVYFMRFCRRVFRKMDDFINCIYFQFGRMKGKEDSSLQFWHFIVFRIFWSWRMRGKLIFFKQQGYKFLLKKFQRKKQKEIVWINIF